MSVAVVIPVLNEEAWIGRCLEQLAGADARHEIIVADGGSTDGTLEAARRHPRVRIVTSSPGRGAQMNAGAAAAASDALLFLHVDTALPPGALEAVEAALADPAVVGGGFLKDYGDAPLAVRAAGFLLNEIRARLFGDLVGTNALFARASTFRSLGGYREWPLLEDVDLCDRLKRAGKLAILPGPVSVSSRKYTREGPLRRIWINARVMFGFRVLGRSPEQLAAIYRGRPAPKTVTIVIPTLDEEAHVASCLSGLSGAEVIVADGGSRDRTRELAASFPGVRVIDAPERGRAAQMNAGAREARGDVLLFLHADCRLPADAIPRVLSGLAASRRALGCFRLELEGDSTVLRCIGGLANLRSRLLGLPYGDQALFLRRRDFEAAGGFPPLPFLEDVALVRRLGRALVLSGPGVRASARRYLARGPVRLSLVNLLILVLYFLGFPPAQLSRLYDSPSR